MKLVVTRSTPARLLAASSNRPSTRAASWGFPSYRDSERADVITLGRRLLCITANLAAHVCPRWVKLRRTQCEQMSSGLPLKADIAQGSRHVSKVPHPDSCSAAGPVGTRVSSRARAQDRTGEPMRTQDQRTGSIKCSYCVPGHIT